MSKGVLFSMIFLIAGLLLAGCKGEAVDLQGEWQLSAYGESSAPTQALPGVETLVSFDGDGQVTGTFGCNSFGGEYSVQENKLRLGPLAATEMFCDQTSAQESAVFEILASSNLTIEINDGAVTLTTEDGASVVILQRK